MKVLCLGLPRTGTTSIKAALHELGYEKVYDTEEIYDLDDSQLWSRICVRKHRDKALTAPDDEPRLKSLLEEYDVICDIPAVLISEELVSAYPDLKVVLTTRSMESWLKSMQQTVVHPAYAELRYKIWGLFDGQYARFRQFMQGYSDALWDDNFAEQGENLFRRHHELVKRIVPPENLLVFDSSKGWEPLCKALGKPVPSTPYPHLHKAGSFRETDEAWIRERMNRLAWVGFLVTTVATTVLIATLRRLK